MNKVNNSPSEFSKEMREAALICFKELVPYLDDEEREKYADAGKSTTFKAFIAGSRATLSSKLVRDMEAALEMFRGYCTDADAPTPMKVSAKALTALRQARGEHEG